MHNKHVVPNSGAFYCHMTRQGIVKHRLCYKFTCMLVKNDLHFVVVVAFYWDLACKLTITAALLKRY